MPYHNLSGAALIDEDGTPHARLRYFEPLGTRGQRYAARPGTPSHVYMPVGLLSVIKSAEAKVLVITEGEKKAIAGCNAGIPTIGIPGVWMWTDPAHRREVDCDGKTTDKINPGTPIHPEIAAIIRMLQDLPEPWSILVLGDSDLEQPEKWQAKRGLLLLAQAIRHQIERNVYYMSCPNTGDGKTGLDDWLLARDHDDVRSAIATATCAPKVFMDWKVGSRAGVYPDPAKSLPDDPKKAESFHLAAAESLKAFLMTGKWNAIDDLRDFVKKAKHSASLPDVAAIEKGLKWAQDQQSGKVLKMGIRWPVVGEIPVLQIEKFDEKKGHVITETHPTAPAAWVERQYRIIGDPHEIEGLPAVLDVACGYADDGAAVRWQLDAQYMTDVKSWLTHGFRGVDAKGLTAYREMGRYRIAAGEVPVYLATPSRGWVNFEHNAKKHTVYAWQSFRAYATPYCPAVEIYDPVSGAGSAFARSVASGGDADIQKAMLRELVKHPPIAAILGLACSSPALFWIGESERCMLHLYGASSHGKTTVLQLAASLMGNGQSSAGQDSQILSWRLTDNGLEAPLAARNDAVAFIDELHMLSDKTELVQALYMATNGRGKERMTKDITQRAALRWRVQILSSGEKSIAGTITESAMAKARESFDGEDISGGLHARIFELNVEELQTIPPVGLVPTLVAQFGKPGDIEGKVVSEAIERLATTNFGHIWKDLLSVIVAKKDSLQSDYDRYEHGLQLAMPADASNIARRRGKHGAAVMVGLGLLLECVGATAEEAVTITGNTLSFVSGTMMPSGLNAMATGTEADQILRLVGDTLATSRGRFFGGDLMRTPASGQAWGWMIQSDRQDSPAGSVWLTSSGVSALAHSIRKDSKRVRKALVDAGWIESVRRPEGVTSSVRVLVSPDTIYDVVVDEMVDFDI
ncbi:DUF927 domain-containing protein [Acidithiobacillus ferrivorans]|nr:DUF927 domain-containing protein [Acidithiobacillus ferrivorans]